MVKNKTFDFEILIAKRESGQSNNADKTEHQETIERGSTTH
ncbi:9835_t:CDS:2 [Ambispora leptoticha]|uniref:9835_t:CDS:1 n=1 Tax=Ambispora leptoticha TaxID=144679 RepID=A0A9N9DNC0_9GLOM|nr:9835_t:CDS:2 [Ambispora leptoticha]